MSEKPNIQELVQQINNLSEEEKGELAKQLDLKEMILHLPHRQREKLFLSLDLIWHHEDYEGHESYQNDLHEAFTVNPEIDISTQTIGRFLIECNGHTVQDSNVDNKPKFFLTFEARTSQYHNELNYVAVPPFPSEALLTYISDYARTLLSQEISELVIDISEQVLRKLHGENAKVMEIVQIADMYKARAKKGLSKLAKSSHRNKTLMKFASLTNSYEEAFKILKKDFKEIYNSVDPRLSPREREDRARRTFIEQYPDLRPEIAKFLGLQFKVKEQAKILAAKDCCLHPHNEQGFLKGNLNNWYTEGKKLLEEESLNDIQSEETK